MKNDFSEQTLIQILNDAGCDLKTIREFMEYVNEGEFQKQLDLLSSYRKKLLNTIHTEEKYISCIDYLVYQLEKQNIYLSKGEL